MAFDGKLAELNAILTKLNPDAEIIPVERGNVPLDKVLNTGKFNFEKAQQAPGWLSAQNYRLLLPAVVDWLRQSL